MLGEGFKYYYPCYSGPTLSSNTEYTQWPIRFYLESDSGGQKLRVCSFGPATGYQLIKIVADFFPNWDFPRIAQRVLARF